ncbi:restriction endonuclease subunit S [Loigolactobacillus backii]|uniref:restriction endonuclease subunit S n=1 Tax=Loigolactobacillus backii TaxID=375175 RepID=UPI0007F17BD6|nr:restriction endonuclease subunit S [Loigolactobacillus backii]ANK61242.1 hypothetical protein AYR52_12900 [Loigolactobacillus backii]
MKDNQAKYPQLRFKGFTDPWEQRKLGDLVDSYNKIVSGKSNYPVATSSRRGLFLQSDYFDGSRSGIDENVDFHKVPEKYITYRHMSDDSIFKFNQNDFDTPVLVSKEYPVFRSNQQANQKFLLDHLNNSPEFLKFSTLQKLGGTRVRLYFKNLQAYKLMTPNIEEQNAIASFFTTVDNLIAANQRKVDLLKEQKKGYLQKMFPKNGAKVPESRFAGFADDWEERKFGELYKKVNEKNDLSFGKDRVISVANMYFKDTGNIRSDDAYMKTYNIFRTGDIAFEGNKSKHFSYGRFVENTIGDGIVSHVFDVFRPIQQFDLNYWKYAIHNERVMGPILMTATTSSTMMTNLVAKDFLKRAILVPSYSEQKFVGSFFQQLDDTIALHQRKLDLLKEQKKGFLQNMFV